MNKYEELEDRFKRIAAEVAQQRGMKLCRVQAAPSQPLVRDAAFYAAGNLLSWASAGIDLQEELTDDDIRLRCEGACLELYFLPGGPPVALINELQYRYGLQGWYLV